MKTAEQLEKEIAQRVQDSGPLLKSYLDYAEGYKQLQNAFVDTVCREMFPDTDIPSLQLGAILSTNLSPAKIRHHLSQLKFKPKLITHDHNTGKIYFWVDEPAPAHGA